MYHFQGFLKKNSFNICFSQIKFSFFQTFQHFLVFFQLNLNGPYIVYYLYVSKIFQTLQSNLRYYLIMHSRCFASSLGVENMDLIKNVFCQPRHCTYYLAILVFDISDTFDISAVGTIFNVFSNNAERAKYRHRNLNYQIKIIKMLNSSFNLT